MDTPKRMLLALLILVAVSGAVLGLEMWRATLVQPASESDLVPGAVPVYLDGKLAAYFSPVDLEQLAPASFIDAEAGMTQSGWMLRDILALYLPAVALDSGTEIAISSSSRAKVFHLTWEEVAKRENMVMFDLSGRGTLKLVSQLEALDSRDEWVQDVDKIEVWMP